MYLYPTSANKTIYQEQNGQMSIEDREDDK